MSSKDTAHHWFLAYLSNPKRHLKVSGQLSLWTEFGMRDSLVLGLRVSSEVDPFGGGRCSNHDVSDVKQYPITLCTVDKE